MATVTIHEAKTHLSKLIARAEAGEEIVISRGKEPVVRLELVAKLQPIVRQHPRREAGWLKEIVESPPDSFFFDPLPEDELALWNGDGPDTLTA